MPAQAERGMHVWWLYASSMRAWHACVVGVEFFRHCVEQIVAAPLLLEALGLVQGAWS
jgi:hypothetical protein